MVNRKELSKLITAARKVVPKTGHLDELCNVWFVSNMIYGQNGIEQISINHSLDLIDLDCGVNAAKLDNLLKQIDAEEIHLEYDNGLLYIDYEGASTTLRAYPIDEYETILDNFDDTKDLIPISSHFGIEVTKELSNAIRATTLAGTTSDQRCWIGSLNDDPCFILTNRVSISMLIPEGWFHEHPVGHDELDAYMNNIYEVTYAFAKIITEVTSKLSSKNLRFFLSKDSDSVCVLLEDAGCRIDCSILDAEFPKGLSKAVFNNLSNKPLTKIPDTFKQAIERVKSVTSGSGLEGIVDLSFEGWALTISSRSIDVEHQEIVDLEEEEDTCRGTAIADSLIKASNISELWCVEESAFLFSDRNLITLVHFKQE